MQHLIRYSTLLTLALFVVSTAPAALIHTDTLPDGVASNRTLIYLDVELESQTVGDTNNDPGITWFRTSQTGCCWGSHTIGGYRSQNRGSGNQPHLNEDAFWQDVFVPAAGLWEVYIHHRLDSSVNDSTTTKSVTNTFYVGSGLSGSTLLDETLVGSATISTTAPLPAIGQWDYLGPVALDGSTIDSFRLNLDAVYALQRTDAVLLVQLPEPSTLAMLLGLGAVGLLGYLRRRRG